MLDKSSSGRCPPLPPPLPGGLGVDGRVPWRKRIRSAARFTKCFSCIAAHALATRIACLVCRTLKNIRPKRSRRMRRARGLEYSRYSSALSHCRFAAAFFARAAAAGSARHTFAGALCAFAGALRAFAGALRGVASALRAFEGALARAMAPGILLPKNSCSLESLSTWGMPSLPRRGTCAGDNQTTPANKL